ncbi:unnamed protein product [Kuraishia capsulata CBS 1993]|uniref:Large ribosomal subunit protein mL38 n=1 Tax=Kuraishia capsulata CBS 1993 TaxID=1382522 RepID=W6MKE0_9ASCO|nr:uncharacterized protein KUCA_T00002795001 [Kuraishia capsulata CBS 1993]CDK26821.1 unnamed protein product [Kuraishia capsulata CBS 1993]
MSLAKGVWSQFSRRSPSLGVSSKALKTALLSPDLPNGPVSFKKRSSKIQYQSPIGMEQVYPLAYEMMEKRSEQVYAKIDQITEEINSAEDGSDLKIKLLAKKDKLLADAEKFNPEVLYKVQFATNSLDVTQPVYRRALKEKWESYAKMLTMQRLETLNVIPDTLPTLEPEVDVKIRFAHNAIETYVEPGKILSSNVTSKPPVIEITEFEEVQHELYTVLIVNPDIPDIENDTFSTTLHWGLKDIPLSNVDNVIDPKKLLEDETRELISYLPPTPEKNAPTNRLAVWVFRQNGVPLEKVEVTREFFNIREFVEQNNLQAVGAHVFRSTWDRNVNRVRELYGLPKGRIFHRVRR